MSCQSLTAVGPRDDLGGVTAPLPPTPDTIDRGLGGGGPIDEDEVDIEERSDGEEPCDDDEEEEGWCWCDLGGVSPILGWSR